jgi:hypothetical protein
LITKRPGTNLKRSVGIPMAKNSVPNTSIQYRKSTPTPDILFGYDADSAFKSVASQMFLLGKDPVANTPGTAFPFLTVEFKGYGPSGGGTFWECTNQTEKKTLDLRFMIRVQKIRSFANDPA